MSKAITAIYRTYAIAQLVRDAITNQGVSGSHVDIIPDTDDQLEVGTYRNDDVLDDLHDLHLPEDDIRTYQQAVRRGDYVVSANVDDDDIDKVMEAMRRPEGEMHDIDRTEDEFRTADYIPPVTGTHGTEGFGFGSSVDADRDTMLERDRVRGHEDASAAGTLGSDGGEVIREAEERLRVGKREVEGRTVHIRSYVHEVPVEERIRLRHERVDVRRRAVDDRVLTGGEADAVFQDRSIDMTEHDEEAVVSKETVVTGEVGISRDTETEERVVSDTVRKTEVEVDEVHAARDRNDMNRTDRR